MEYIKQVKEHLKSIRELRKKNVSPESVLLGLLREFAPKSYWGAVYYVSTPDEIKYLMDKLYDVFESEDKYELKDKKITIENLTAFINEIDAAISGDTESRREHKITEPHNDAGAFHALLVAFLFKYPEAITAESLTAKNSIIRNCLEESQTLPGVLAMEKISKDAWGEIAEYSGSSAINLAAADKKRHRFLKDRTANAIEQRRKFLHHVEEWESDHVRAMLNVDSGLVIEPWYNAERDVIRIACLDQNKEMYYLLISHLPKIEDPDSDAVFQAQLNEFHYLVRGGQRGRAEEFLEQFDDLKTRAKLIFGCNYQGFSAINYYALDNDVEGRLRLYRQLTDNPEELKQEYQKLYPENIKPEQEEASWDEYLESLMSQLDAKYKDKAAEHINEISNDKNLADQFTNFFNKYKAAFKRMINHYKKKEWGAGDKVWVETIGKMQRKIPRWLLYEIFRPGQPFYNNSNPDKLLRTGYAAEPNKLDFTLDAHKNLFTTDKYKDLGKLFGVFRDGTSLVRFALVSNGRFVESAEIVGQLSAVSREIEVTEQKSIKESLALQQLAHVLKK